MRTWLVVVALAVLTAVIVLVVLARRPADAVAVSTQDAISVAVPLRVIDAASRPDAIADAMADASVADAAPPAPAPELETLRSSGSANEVWAAQGNELLRMLDPTASVECYVAGCGAQLTFPSEDAYERAVSVIAADRTWTGGKKWTTPVRTGDGLTVALILYRPD